MSMMLRSFLGVVRVAPTITRPTSAGLISFPLIAASFPRLAGRWLRAGARTGPAPAPRPGGSHRRFPRNGRGRPRPRESAPIRGSERRRRATRRSVDRACALPPRARPASSTRQRSSRHVPPWGDHDPPDGPEKDLKTLRNRLRVAAVEGAGELRPRRDIELAVGALQIRLDGLDAHEHLLADRLVAQAVGGELRDAELGRAQLLRRAPHCDPAELLVDAGEPGLGAFAGEELTRLVQRESRLALPLQPPLQTTLDEKGPRALEGHWAALVLGERALERLGARVELALRGQHETPAPRRDREAP